jgi:putative spermidine/putrescine transport system substrate-binding protein
MSVQGEFETGAERLLLSRRLLGRGLLAGGLLTAAACSANGTSSNAGGNLTSTGGAVAPSSGPASSAAGATSSAAGAPAATSSFTLYAGADTNVQTLWSSSLIPGFEKAFPQYKVNFVFSEHGTNDDQEYARLAASIKTNGKPPADMIADSGFINTAATAGQLMAVTTSNVPNLAGVQKPLLAPVDGRAVPYRGSAVLLAYDSTKVTKVPKTLDDLLAWIRANPGRFTYNSPSTGGSGGAFVETVVDRYTPAADLAKLDAGADPSAESDWSRGLEVLHSLNPDIYSHVYPNGNDAVLALLGKGQIWMAPVWSDQFLSAVSAGQLPPTTKVTQISDPSFTGGGSYLGIPLNSGNAAGALALANFVLEPAQQAEIVSTIAGFPAVPVTTLPAAAQKRLAGTDANNLRAGLSSDAGNDLSEQWQSKVPG